MERTISLKPASDADTVEGKLASGIALASLQQHHFANEPVRLQLVVDSERERDEIVRRVSERLAAAKVSDLAGDRAKEEAAGARAVDATFFYQGRPGVNFPDRTSQQLLVRAQPRQVETVLKEVDRVARRDDQLALQAGPLSMQGRRGIDALQLFADAASPAPGRDAARERVISAPAVAEADGSKQDEEAARFVRELLKTAGIDPSKVASGGPAGSAERPRRARAGGDVRSQPASTTEEESAAVADVGSAVSAPAAAGAKQESHLTFVLEVLAKPKSSTPTGGGNLRRSGTSRNSSRSEAGQPGLHLPS
jgi:pyruvate/2-oxoglutarate dehydrogenase complex dihydrolipoamide acyltransferase (E2) component